MSHLEKSAIKTEEYFSRWLIFPCFSICTVKKYPAHPERAYEALLTYRWGFICFFPILPQSGQKLHVLRLVADGDTQAASAKFHSGAVPHDDALPHQVVVDGLGVGHASQEEVSVRRVYLLTDGQVGEGGGHLRTLL